MTMRSEKRCFPPHTAHVDFERGTRAECADIVCRLVIVAFHDQDFCSKINVMEVQ
jgi:hypothetical protein